MSGHGMAGFLGIGHQTTWGTAVAATNYLTIMSENLTESRDRFEVANIHGGVHEPDDIAGVRRVAGDITFSGNAETIGYFLQGVLGRTTVTSLSADLAVSSFKPRITEASSLHPLDIFSFEVFRDVGSSQQYADCSITMLELSLAPNQALQCKATILGRTSTNIQKTTPSFVTSPVDPFTFGAASLAIGGNATDLVEGITLSINNNLSGRPSINNSNTIARVKRDGPVEVRLSGNIGFENITELGNFTNQTEQALKLNLFESASFSLLIDVPRFIYSAFPLSMGGREYQLVNFEGRPKYLVSSATAIEAILTTVNSEW